MLRAAPLYRLPALLLVVMGAVLLVTMPRQPAVFAAIPPEATTFSTAENIGWVINELHADPADDLTGDANGDGLRSAIQDEFVELFNDTGATADISGWTLADAFELRHVFPAGSVVPDQCAIVVFGGGIPTGTFGNALVQVASQGRLGMDNSGDTITFSDGSETIQSVQYGFEGGENQSLTRNPDVSGLWERHLTASAPQERRFSPGTRLDGQLFWGCPGYDAPPFVLETLPADGAVDVATNSAITITFSEAVSLNTPWFEIACSQSGIHSGVVSGDSTTAVINPDLDFAGDESCQVTLFGAAIVDQDGEPQQMEADKQWQFTTTAAPVDFILINELDAETLGPDAAEFIELYDGGIGQTGLDGLSIVLFNGQDDHAYASFDLSDFYTDSNGYFSIGNRGVPGVDLVMDDSLLQNGADAVALYQASASQLPPGTAVTTENLLDAIVYGSNQEVDTGLLILLLEGERQVDENARNLADFHSLQRCPNASGGQRRTGTIWPDTPTPKTANTCVLDSAPEIAGTTPANGERRAPSNSTIEITFSEGVNVYGQWFDLTCERSGRHEASYSGGETYYVLHPARNFAYGEQCQVTVFGGQVSDLDALDPPDHLAADYAWSFVTLPAGHILINEVNADSEGVDTQEFIELFDGGVGHTALDGLVLVFFNGFYDLSYGAIDLDGQQTDGQGRFVIGNLAVPNVDLVLPDGTLQNGADAVALYAADGQDFPNRSPLSVDHLLDAVVYGTGDATDLELLQLLLQGEQQVDENGRNNAEWDSSQRCPDGEGGQRRSGAFVANLATPGNINKCTFDRAPYVLSTSPGNGEIDVALEASITISFSEEVNLKGNWFTFDCVLAGNPAIGVKHTADQVILEPQGGLSRNDTCTVTVLGMQIGDVDIDDPPDRMEGDYSWSFNTVKTPLARHMIINEVDADTPGVDTAEFIELFDGGSGNTALDGLVVVLFNGADDLSYGAIDLDGQQTDEQGQFVIGNLGVPNVDLVLPDGTLQNGADAVALYAANSQDFPNRSPIAVEHLLDAVVYGTGDAADLELLQLLLQGEQQVNENGRNNAEWDSSQRCPNGGGGQRRSASFVANLATPGEVNKCTFDKAPYVLSTSPDNGDSNVAVETSITINFSEEVNLQGNWFTFDCVLAGSPAIGVNHAADKVILDPQGGLLRNDTCSVTVLGNQVSDLDSEDPPDQMEGDYSWSFETVKTPLARHMVINEVDADTPGVDTAEFIELFDGGDGNTPLDGLTVVLFNGADDLSYRTIDLSGRQTNSAGYFVIGGSAVSNIDLIIPDGAIQNGPDAVALYEKEAVGQATGLRPTVEGLLDALIYHTNDANDPGLSPLLVKGEPQLNEGTWRDPAWDSNQRCPNGKGGQRRSAGHVQNLPTPGTANSCTVDKPPEIVSFSPKDGTPDVPIDSNLSVVFSEPVSIQTDWIQVVCKQQGTLTLKTTGGPKRYLIKPAILLMPNDSCAAKVLGNQVHDRDGYKDPLPGDISWRFMTGVVPVSVSAGFTSNSPVTIGAPVQFANVSFGQGTLTYEWDFGDSSPIAYVEEPSHTYSAVGTYMVTLTARTSSGEMDVYSSPAEIKLAHVFVPILTR